MSRMVAIRIIGIRANTDLRSSALKALSSPVMTSDPGTACSIRASNRFAVPTISLALSSARSAWSRSMSQAAFIGIAALCSAAAPNPLSVTKSPAAFPGNPGSTGGRTRESANPIQNALPASFSSNVPLTSTSNADPAPKAFCIVSVSPGEMPISSERSARIAASATTPVDPSGVSGALPATNSTLSA